MCFEVNTLLHCWLAADSCKADTGLLEVICVQLTETSLGADEAILRTLQNYLGSTCFYIVTHLHLLLVLSIPSSRYSASRLAKQAGHRACKRSLCNFLLHLKVGNFILSSHILRKCIVVCPQT